jgi:hypothetical protein
VLRGSFLLYSGEASEIIVLDYGIIRAEVGVSVRKNADGRETLTLSPEMPAASIVDQMKSECHRMRSL